MESTSSIARSTARLDHQSRDLNGYQVRDLNDLDPAALEASFDRLPVDPHQGGDAQYRRFSRFRVIDGRPIELGDTTFVQSRRYNRLLGGVARVYEPLEDAVVALPEFKRLMRVFLSRCRGPLEGRYIGVHQLRARCTWTAAGEPTPEGIHQEGVDQLALFCVARSHIHGGLTSLYARAEERPVFTTVLHPGQLLLVDDRRLLHYTSPITPRGASWGHRDIFLFTL